MCYIVVWLKREIFGWKRIARDANEGRDTYEPVALTNRLSPTARGPQVRSADVLLVQRAEVRIAEGAVGVAAEKVHGKAPRRHQVPRRIAGISCRIQTPSTLTTTSLQNRNLYS